MERKAMFGCFWLGVLITLVTAVAFYGGIAWVIVHFIHKFW